MAHFDAYGRPLRGDSRPEYDYETYETYNFNDSNRNMPAYSNPLTSNRYTTESRDIPYACQSASNVPSHSPQQSYPSNNKMGTAYGPDRGTSVDHGAVPPEIIAAITEKVKRERKYMLYIPLLMACLPILVIFVDEPHRLLMLTESYSLSLRPFKAIGDL